MYAKLKNKLNIKGSVLVFSLIIMGIILIAAIGIAAVSVTEQKNVGTTAKSTQSFQVASSASELLLQQVKNNPTVALNAISGWTCNSTTGNVAKTANSMVGGNAEIVFYDSEYDTANKIPCDTAGKTLANVRKIKSTGTYAGTVRAIEMAVAVNGCQFVVVDVYDCDGRPCSQVFIAPGSEQPLGSDATMNKVCQTKLGNNFFAVAGDNEHISEPTPAFTDLKKWVVSSGVWKWSIFALSARDRLDGLYCCPAPTV